MTRSEHKTLRFQSSAALVRVTTRNQTVRGVATGHLLSPPSLSPDVASSPGGISNAEGQGGNAHGDEGRGQSMAEGAETGSEDDSYSSGESDTEEDEVCLFELLFIDWCLSRVAVSLRRKRRRH